jgi:O-antigen ligase
MNTVTDTAPLPSLPLARGATLRLGALFLAFLISGGMLLFPRVPILLLILLCCLLAPGFRLVLRRELVPPLVLISLVTMVTLLRPGPLHLESLAIRLGNFLAALALLNLYLGQPRNSLAADLYRVLGWMAIQALLTVALAHTLGFLFLPLDVSGTTYQTFLLLLNYHVTIEDAGGLVRPDGFFFEPGVFQIYLNLYLYLALFVYRNVRRSGLALAAVLSTQSTTGLAVCLLLLAAFAISEIRRSPLRRKLLLVVASAIVVAPVAILGYGNLTEKLFGEFRGSSWARTYDLITGLNVLAAHPWVGIGFDHERYKEEAAQLGYADTQLNEEQAAERSTSNGNLLLLYSLGIPLGLPFLIGMFRQRFLPHRGLVGLLLLLGFMGEAIIMTPFFLLLILSGLPLPAMSRAPPVPAGEPAAR